MEEINFGVCVGGVAEGSFHEVRGSYMTVATMPDPPFTPISNTGLGLYPTATRDEYRWVEFSNPKYRGQFLGLWVHSNIPNSSDAVYYAAKKGWI